VVCCDLAIVFRNLEINEVLVHSLIERDHDRGIRLKAHGSRIIKDRTDFIAGEGHNLVALSKHFYCRFSFIGTQDFSTVAFEISTRDVNCHTTDFSVNSLAIRFASDKAFIPCLIICLSRAKELMTCMDYFIGLEGTITIRLSQEMRVWRLVEPDKELVLVDSSDLA